MTSITTITDLVQHIADHLEAMGVETADRDELTATIQRHRLGGYEEQDAESLDTLLRAVWDEMTEEADWPEGTVTAEAEGYRAVLNGSRVNVFNDDDDRWAGEGSWDGTIYDGGGNLDENPDRSAEIMEALANALRAKIGVGEPTEAEEPAEDDDAAYFRDGDLWVAVLGGMPSHAVQVGVGETREAARASLEDTPIQSEGHYVARALDWAAGADWITTDDLPEAD